MNAALVDLELIRRGAREDPRGPVENRRIQRRVLVGERDGLAPREEKRAGPRRVAHEDAVVQRGVGGGAAVEEVIVGGSEGGREAQEGEESQSEEVQRRLACHGDDEYYSLREQRIAGAQWQ